MKGQSYGLLLVSHAQAMHNTNSGTAVGLPHWHFDKLSLTESNGQVFVPLLVLSPAKDLPKRRLLVSEAHIKAQHQQRHSG